VPHLHRHGRCRRASHETGLGPPAGTALQIPLALTDRICWECISARSSPPTLPGPGSEPVLLQLEAWDNIIRGQVAYQGPVYTGLLPDGRETLTLGTREEQLVELTALAGRLAAQVGKPLLVTLGATVLAFGNSANALRSTQINAKAALEGTRLAQEPLRRTMIDKYLTEDFTVDWSSTSLAAAGDLFAENLRRKFPELDSTSARGLANRFTYSWR